MNSELPKDPAPKPEPLSEDEKSARQLADAIADASDRSLNGKVDQDMEQQMKHPFSSGLNSQYKNLANQLNSWEENNSAMYRYETERLQKMIGEAGKKGETNNKTSTNLNENQQGSNQTENVGANQSSRANSTK